MIEDSEGYYVVCGWTNSFGAGGKDVYVLKVNSMGDTVWTRTYGGTGEDSGKEIFQTSDGGYLIAGNSNSFSSGGLNEIYILRLNNSGDTVWTRTYGDTIGIEMTAAEILDEDGMIISGRIGNHNPYLLKIDSSGLLLSKIVIDTLPSIYQVNDIDITHDGNFVLACDDNVYMKIDNNGNIFWLNEFYWDFPSAWFTCIQETDDSNYIVGFNYIFPASGIYFTIEKKDSLGNTLWHWYGAKDNISPYHEDIITDLKSVDENTYIISGHRYTLNDWDKYPIFVCIDDLDTCCQTVFSYYPFSNIRSYFNSVYPLQNSGYIIAGGVLDSNDLYLVKTDSMGVFVEELPIPQPPTINSIIVSSIDHGSIFTITLHENTDLKLSVYDVMGRLVSAPLNSRLSMGIHKIPFNPENTGIYFFRLESDGFTETGKFTVLR